MEIKDKRDVENLATDHLSRLEHLESKSQHELEINDFFPPKSIFMSCTREVSLKHFGLQTLLTIYGKIHTFFRFAQIR